MWLVCLFFSGLSVAAAGGTAPAASTPAKRAEEAYEGARARYEAEPTNNTLAWKFASACFDECEFAGNNAERERVAKEGIAACRQALGRDAGLAQAHYYLGMDLAQLARTKLIGALGLLGEIEQEWERARELDENFDFAGADRNLGTLYLRAPGWPLSLGSRTNARVHLERAVALHPEYPENRLDLLEAYVKWNRAAESVTASNALAQMWPEAREKFAGTAWESYWEDWDGRLAALQREMRQEATMNLPRGRK